MNKNKLIIILVGFLDVLGIGIIIPTLPDLAQYYDVSAQRISYGITVYALFSFLAAPLLGQISDIFWRKKILILCVIWSFISALVIALSRSFPLFIIGRIINWITGGNISILQAIIADISPTKEERTANMGILGALFGSAFIVWPLFGAFLLHFGVTIPYWFMAFFALIEVFVIFFVYRETNAHIWSRRIIWNPIGQIVSYLRKPKVNMYIISLFTILLAFAIYQSIFSLYLGSHYHLSWSVTGYVMAGFGVIMVGNQLFLLKQFWLKHFALATLLWIITIGSCAFFILLALIEPLTIFLSIFLLLVPLQSLINPIYNSEIVDTVAVTARGEVMGVLSSLQAITMFIWPLIGGIMIEDNLPIFAISAIFALINIFFVSRIIKQHTATTYKI